jgi:hypothetical protein
MTISFPLSLPDTRSVSAITIRSTSVVGVSTSPFTMEQQVYRHAGQMLSADVQLKILNRAEAEPWIAWQFALNGREGTFLMGDPLGATPRGIATGSPLVKGASQTGQSLITDGWTAGVTGILKAGDWIQLGSGSSARLYKVLADANSNGSTEATLDLYPRLRASPADNAVITVTNTVGLWRLATNNSEWSEQLAQLYSISFSCHEAI